MKPKSPLMLVIALFFLLGMLLQTVMAGDELNPEVDDEIGDTDPGNQFRDIVSAWFSETNNSVLVYLKMAGNPPNLADLRNERETIAFDYEVYFDVEGENYAACATIQYAASVGGAVVEGGFYQLQDSWGWEVRRVDYATGTNFIQKEEAAGDADGTYTGQSVLLEWTVDKEIIGIGKGIDGRGQLLENTWAAVWNTQDAPSDSQRDPTSQAWDYAHTHHTDPGENYRIKGFSGIDYNIILSTDDADKETYGGTPVEFQVRVENEGTHNFDVAFFTSTDLPEGWMVILNPNSTTIAKGAIRSLEVVVTPPKKVTNGTVQTFRIEGNINEIEGNGSTVPVQPPLTLSVTALSSSGGSEEGAWWENIMDMLKGNIIIVGGALAVVIIAIIILVILIRR